MVHLLYSGGNEVQKGNVTCPCSQHRDSESPKFGFPSSSVIFQPAGLGQVHTNSSSLYNSAGYPTQVCLQRLQISQYRKNTSKNSSFSYYILCRVFNRKTLSADVNVSSLGPWCWYLGQAGPQITWPLASCNPAM